MIESSFPKVLSIMLNKSVSDITDLHSRLIAYQLSNRIFTALELHRLCGGKAKGFICIYIADDASFRETFSNGF